MATLDCHKVTLSSGKVVLLQDFKIKHQRLAAQSAGSKSGDNPNVMGVVMLEELVKLLVVKVNDQPVEKSSLEDLDSVFSYREYSEIQQVVGQMMGVGQGEQPVPKMERVSSGAQ